MKKIMVVFVLISTFSWAQSNFFDEDDHPITKEQFINRILKNGELKVYNDSLKKAKILSSRSENGKINSNEIIGKLSKSLRLELKDDHPLVVFYYPGKDPCNSTGSSTPESSFLWFKKLEKQTNRIQKSKFLYVYKDKRGIKTINKINWNKDPQNLIENTFFNYHYPCSSYVIIYKNRYISYFGEYSPDYVLRDIKIITE